MGRLYPGLGDYAAGDHDELHLPQVVKAGEGIAAYREEVGALALVEAPRHLADPACPGGENRRRLDDRRVVPAGGGEYLEARDVVVHPVFDASQAEPRVGTGDDPHARVPEDGQPRQPRAEPFAAQRLAYLPHHARDRRAYIDPALGHP